MVKHQSKKLKKRAIFVCLLLLNVMFLAAQDMIRTSGKATDETNETLVGVSILEKGTMNGTVTDANGDYSLTVNQRVFFSFQFSVFSFQRNFKPQTSNFKLQTSILHYFHCSYFSVLFQNKEIHALRQMFQTDGFFRVNDELGMNDDACGIDNP